MIKINSIIKNITALFIGVVIVFVSAEAILKFMPVCDGLFCCKKMPESDEYHFDVNREYTWSKNWNFSLVNKIKTNNYGFINRKDYGDSSNEPLLCVIGDSYVEAAMVPLEDTFHDRLRDCYENRGRVYTFAASGAGLSQYLAWARFARRKWEPNGYIFTIISNDFSDSLKNIKVSPGMHQYVEKRPGVLCSEKNYYSPSWKRTLVEHSHFLRYILINIKFIAKIKEIRNMMQGEVFVGNVKAWPGEDQCKLETMVLEKFFQDLSNIVGDAKKNTIFVIDGIRPELYYEFSNNGNKTESHCAKMRNIFIETAVNLNYECIDMHKIFTDHYKKNGLKFEFTDDNHWNSLGHKIVAESIKNSEIVNKVFSRQ